MTQLRLREAADLLAVSTDTVRRMVEAGRLPATRDEAGVMVVAGADLAALAAEIARPPEVGVVREDSARNRMRGIVTEVVRDTVMAKVAVQAGPHRIVSLMSREAADELGLEVGSVAVASIKSTNVTIGVPERR